MQSTAHEAMEAQGGIGRPRSVFEISWACRPIFHFILKSILCAEYGTRHICFNTFVVDVLSAQHKNENANGWSGHGGGEAEGQWINRKTSTFDEFID